MVIKITSRKNKKKKRSDDDQTQWPTDKLMKRFKINVALKKAADKRPNKISLIIKL